jgi:DNA-binding NtrC family response regulator
MTEPWAPRDERPAGGSTMCRLARAEVKMTVLVIDDDDAMRALMRDVLVRSGQRVIERPDGADLPDLAENERFDVVILDKQLPGAGGLDLLAFLRTRLPAVPVIVITAFGGPDVAAEASVRGAYRVLEKPFRMARLLEALAGVPVAPSRVEFGRIV